MSDQNQAVTLFETYYREYGSRFDVEVKELQAGQAILAASPAMQIAVIRVALAQPIRNGQGYPRFILLSQLVKRHLPYTPDDICAILNGMRATIRSHYSIAAQALLRSLARPLAEPTTLTACRRELVALQEAVFLISASADQRKLLKLLNDILNGQQPPSIPIVPDEWGRQVLPLLEAMPPEQYTLWLALLQHCCKANGNVPTKTWYAQMQKLRKPLYPETFTELAITWLHTLRYGREARLDEENANLLKGLAWSCLDSEEAALADALGDTAIEGYHKVSGLGPRTAKVAGACIYALKNMPGLCGAAQLERVRLAVKQPTFLKGIEQALETIVARTGMSREALEELTVPTFELEQGYRSLTFGAAVVQIQVVGINVHLQWYDATGRLLKTEPAVVKRTYKAELKDLKRQVETISNILKAQRDRLEHLPLTERTWPLSVWRERYLDHPLIGSLSRKLLWRFHDGERIISGIWCDGQLVDAHEQPLSLSETTSVSPWHAIQWEATEVLAWRLWLERHQVTQPFKQAHREVYLLTDAERATRTYSNRFAAHILRQHQFHALTVARHWQNQLRLMVDGEYAPARLVLPHWGLRAEFWVEGIAGEYGEVTNETGTYFYLTTDQVRFYPLDAAENSVHAGGGGYHPAYRYRQQPQLLLKPVSLEQIPSLIFSEVMRDVDLFVGVASVGNDPTWQDGGPQGHYRDYWYTYSFGALSATAQTRKECLSRLLPRLTIGNRCSIEGHFLIVRGDLRTYKIHLGSSNILMEPNAQYLCIVPGRGTASMPNDKLFLPFEGDSVLALILSKAFLLAEDAHITDSSITRQIKRG